MITLWYHERDEERFKDFQNWEIVPRKMGKPLIRKIKRMTREKGVRTMR